MNAPAHEAAIAFTYAWWLTGDDNAAQAAVLAAARTTRSDTGQLPALLRAVRAHAVSAPTMCPASELALLHDGQDVPLDVAAELADVPAAEAPAELAHGRLEALLETVTAPFSHPERLGGLAVGNPPDTAHARTCVSCAQAQQLLRRGREELVALAPRPAPAEVLARFPEQAPAATPAPEVAPESGPPAGPAPAPATAPDPATTAPDPASRPTTAPPLPRATRAQRRGTVLVAFLVTAAALLLLLTALSGDGSAAGPAAVIL